MATFAVSARDQPTSVSVFSPFRTETAIQTFTSTLHLSYDHALTLLVFSGYIASGLHPECSGGAVDFHVSQALTVVDSTIVVELEAEFDSIDRIDTQQRQQNQVVLLQPIIHNGRVKPLCRPTSSFVYGKRCLL